MENCQFCGNKNLSTTETEYTYKQEGNYFIVHRVPCKKCQYCGEKYFDANTLKQIENEYRNIYFSGKKAKKEIRVPVEKFEDLEDQKSM